MRQRILNILVSLDCFIYVLFTLGVGWPGETISSAAYRAELHGKFFRHARPVIDWLFSGLEKDHCRLAYEYAVGKRNLPEDMR
jgi:hypothetical protein